jgi:DNA-binding transcriptional MerR regulator
VGDAAFEGSATRRPSSYPHVQVLSGYRHRVPQQRATEWLKIGELARRTGTTTDVLRAWERRYGLLQPRRTAGNQRLYSTVDEHRVRIMLRHLESGRSAHQAAELTSALRLGVPPGEHPAVPPAEVERAHQGLRTTLDAFEETAAQRVLESLLAAHQPLAVLRDVVLPYLREVGDRWAAGHVTVAQEHFATAFFESRFSALARGWDRGTGPRALLACPGGERHTFGLLAFGIALHARGWRIVWLGADTGVGTVEEAADRLAPDLVVLAAADPDRLRADDALRRLAGRWPCALAGAGAVDDVARDVGARLLAEDPVTAAAQFVG